MDFVIAGMLILALAPAALYWINTWLYRRPPKQSGQVPPVSVLIPARNEGRSIRAAIDSVLFTRGVEFELIILDDHSTDQTAAIVQAAAACDSRVRLIESAPLPSGWSGKQFACYQLALAARHDLLLFVDADVRLAPDAIPRLVEFIEQSKADLISGVPRQKTGTTLETLVIPLVHFLLLGYLPFAGMRMFRHPAWAAGCGQLFLARRSPYEMFGGHAAIRESMHDGITLPRAFRRAGFRTDLCDATDLATCRMYHTGRELWTGLAKNAHEGLGSPKNIVPWTTILIGGQVLPWLMLTVAPLSSAFAIAAGYSMRLDSAVRFRQSWLGALLHPVGVLLLVAIQLGALIRRAVGWPVGWKGRPAPNQEVHADDPGAGVNDSPTYPGDGGVVGSGGGKR
jgi:hypothetical protein